MIAKAIRVLIFVLSGFVLTISTSGVDAQQHVDPAWIVYECLNGIAVRNICVIREDNSEAQQITHSISSNRQFIQPAINVHGKIAHVCKLVDDRNDICTMDPDGSNLEQVSLTTLYDHNLNPDINDAGDIVFGCYSNSVSHSVCVLDAGSTIVRELAEDVWITDFPKPQIDNAGRILFPCRSTAVRNNLCIINIDGSGLRYLLEIEDFSESNSNGHMNNNGHVVFECNNQDLGQGICISNLDTQEVSLLMETNDKLRVSNPYINDSGQIVFNCSSQQFTTDICGMTLDDKVARRITSAEENTDYLAGAITSNGVIAFRCVSHGNKNLCTINFDGSNFQQRTFFSDREENSEPVINNLGQIAFRCESASGEAEACFMNDVDAPIINLSQQHQIHRMFEIDMNDRGEIAMSCQLQFDDGIDLCVIDLTQETIKILTDNPFPQGNGVYYVTVNNLGIIAYKCAQQGLGHICYSTADGTEEGILIKDQDEGYIYADLSINDHNQIALLCLHREIGQNICLLDLESNLTMITHAAEDSGIRYLEPEINNFGRLAMSCSDSRGRGILIHVCGMNLDGSDYVNYAINSSESLAGHESAINDQNIVAYTCRNNERRGYDICIIYPQLDGTFIEERVINDFVNTEPALNNQNELVYKCTDLQGNNNICYHNLETGKAKQLTFLDAAGSASDINSQ